MRAEVECDFSRDCYLDNPTRHSDDGTLDHWRKGIFRCQVVQTLKSTTSNTDRSRLTFNSRPVRYEDPGDDLCNILAFQQQKTQAVLWPLDREAIEMCMIIVILLNGHVNSIWHIRVTPWLLARDHALGVCIHRAAQGAMPI